MCTENLKAAYFPFQEARIADKHIVNRNRTESLN